MVTVYRGVLEKPIVFSGSLIITAENLYSIDFDKVIYCEVSPVGAMGNEGGILIYVLGDKDNLITYETNVFIDKESCDATLELINQRANLFIDYYGGMGNRVYIKKDTQLEIDEKYNCFWYHSQNTKLRINSSVEGVFISVIAEMKSKEVTKK
jgi:hypothetical protein